MNELTYGTDKHPFCRVYRHPSVRAHKGTHTVRPRRTHPNSFKIFINAELCRDAGSVPFFVPVDFSTRATATITTARSARTALNTLKEGGTLVVFPAGGISTATGWFESATDKK